MDNHVGSRVYGLHLVCGVCVALLVSNCYTLPPIPAIRTPIPLPLHDLLLEADDLPRLEHDVEWGQTEPFDALDQWDWSNAIAAMEVWFDYGTHAYLIYTIVQYGDSVGAEGAWTELRDSSVVPEVSGEEVDVLSIEHLPPLHADNILLRCEKGGGQSEVPSHADCVARLQYNVLYLQFHTRISEDTFSPDQFYELLQMVDDRLRPIWETSVNLTPTSSVSEPTLEITPTFILSATGSLSSTPQIV